MLPKGGLYWFLSKNAWVCRFSSNVLTQNIPNWHCLELCDMDRVFKGQTRFHVTKLKQQQKTKPNSRFLLSCVLIWLAFDLPCPCAQNGGGDSSSWLDRVRALLTGAWGGGGGGFLEWLSGSGSWAFPSSRSQRAALYSLAPTRD